MIIRNFYLQIGRQAQLQRLYFSRLMISLTEISLVSQLIANGVLNDEFVVLLRRIAQHHPHLVCND